MTTHEILPPPTSTHQLLVDAGGAWPDGIATQWIPDPEAPVAYVVPAGPGRLDEADLLAWAGTAIDEPAARPERIYPVDAIPVTAVGKPFKPALTADAAVCAIAEALAAAGLPDARAAAAYEGGRLVVTVTGTEPGRVRDAVGGFALTIRSGPSPAAQTTTK